MTFRVVRLLLVVVAIFAAWLPRASASNDTYSSRQWGLETVGGEEAWGTGRGEGMTIAVVDTGVDLSHPDLAGSFVAGYDFVADDADAQDQEGHGTHVAGIAAARADNSIGVAGVAPEARIMPIRVLDAKGEGSLRDVESGVRWAVDHGADVINLSLSGGIVIENVSGGTLTDAVNYAWSKGVVPVVAAGNEVLPRTEQRKANTLIVTATTRNDTKAYYADDVGFAKWGIAAPGGDDLWRDEDMIFSTLWDEDVGSAYGWAAGTSMAAPHVAGAAAVLRGLGLSARQTVDRLLSTAKDLGSSGEDLTYGHGRLDVAAAVAGLGRTSSQPKQATEATSQEDAAQVEGIAAERSSGSTPTPRSSSGPRAAGPPAAALGATAAPAPTDPTLVSSPDAEPITLPNAVIGGALLVSALGLVGYARLRARRSAV